MSSFRSFQFEKVVDRGVSILFNQISLKIGYFYWLIDFFVVCNESITRKRFLNVFSNTIFLSLTSFKTVVEAFNFISKIEKKMYEKNGEQNKKRSQRCFHHLNHLQQFTAIHLDSRWFVAIQRDIANQSAFSKHRWIRQAQFMNIIANSLLRLPSYSFGKSALDCN